MSSTTHLVCEYRNNPLGIDVTAPRFSWQLHSDQIGARQTAYQILAASDAALLHEGKADVWDSGKIESNQSVHVVYAGAKLTSRQRVYWTVTVWDETGKPSQGEMAWFELGLLKRSEWKGKWIGAALVGGPRTTIPSPYLRKSFKLPAGVQSARLYITVLGLFEASINGKTIGEDVLVPGWTEYKKRVQYKVYDVGDQLHEGDNVLGAILGDGWAVGHLSWGHRQQYIDGPRLMAQLEVTLADGSKVLVATDRTWKHQFGPILESDMQMGESYDARHELPGWNAAEFDDKRWLGVEVFDDTGIALSATNGPSVRRMETLKPVAPPTEQGHYMGKRYIFDLGQNMAGWVRFKGSAPAGTTITFRFAEVLNPDKSLYVTNLRSARATDYYTFKGEGVETWEPKFTFHGFRYVEVTGYPGPITGDIVTGIVLYSEMAKTGDFACSEPLINQLQSNIVWGQKGNFLDVPTDCPQRDERLGWTGDIQVFSRTAAFNMDVAGFMSKWALDVADAQGPKGEVPAVVPNVLPLIDGGPAWADAAIICPWTMYQSYGDKRILEKSYATMVKFVDYLLETSEGYIRVPPGYKGFPGFGDWLSINANTPKELIGTAFLAYDANLMAQIASALGKVKDAAKYRNLFGEVKKAFAARYLAGHPGTVAGEAKPIENPDNGPRGNLPVVDYPVLPSEVFNTDAFAPSQTAYVLALYFDLLPEKLRAKAAAELVTDIERRDMHLSTGFVGASYLPYALSNHGQRDTAYALMNQKTWPSWLYAVTKGATTIWERWDGFTEENGFQDPGMNSFNHYAYGAIGSWLYNTTAGIEPSIPGYKHIRFQPQPGGGLTHAEAMHDSLYGRVSSKWQLQDGRFTLTVTVPPNTAGTVIIPVYLGKQVTAQGAAQGAALESAAGVSEVKHDANATVIEIGAGTFTFEVQA